MATSLTRRAAWTALALAAAGFVGFVALHGERPEAGLDRFESAGFLAGTRPQDVRDVLVEAGGQQWLYHRDTDGVWSINEPPASVEAEAGPRVDQALALLRDSKPERRFTADEAAKMPAADLGLAPPVVTVTVIGVNGSRFAIAFGTANPLGHARYARIAGHDTLWLVPRHVADAWDEVVKNP
ncbi:MAG: DUF4340 domain-containing protein [Alphaproteobacteria bacterium]|nr:DUF4340 domain-containing protein [Alphaproteobacteria bacterium]